MRLNNWRNMKIIELNTKEEIGEATNEFRTPSVYLLRCNEFYKIGRSGNILSRIEGLQIGNPYPIDLLFFCRTLKDLEVERKLHTHFVTKKVRGEWFQLSERDLEYFYEIITNTWTK